MTYRAIFFLCLICFSYQKPSGEGSKKYDKRSYTKLEKAKSTADNSTEEKPEYTIEKLWNILKKLNYTTPTEDSTKITRQTYTFYTGEELSSKYKEIGFEKFKKKMDGEKGFKVYEKLKNIKD